jgi:hypothetical protein
MDTQDIDRDEELMVYSEPELLDMDDVCLALIWAT